VLNVIQLQLLLAGLLGSHGSAPPEELTVDVTGLKSSRGTCQVQVFGSANAFPAETSRAITSVSGTIAGGKCRVKLNDLAPGEYAIAVVHDENGNGKLDTTLLGMPKEGVGNSNNPARAGGPPSFSAAKFTFSGGRQVVVVTIRYW
jgi:uncharacterized protein (DUF2141 family)